MKVVCHWHRPYYTCFNLRFNSFSLLLSANCSVMAYTAYTGVLTLNLLLHTLLGPSSLTDLVRQIHLPTWRPPWGPTSFAPMAVSSMIDRVTELLSGAEGAILTDLEDIVWTYQLIKLVRTGQIYYKGSKIALFYNIMCDWSSVP